MAEAVGIAASVIGIVGFAGQVLQGCQIVRSFLDDLKGAPAYIEDLRTILQAFQASLAALVSQSKDVKAGSEDLRLALEYSAKCIRSLQLIVDNLQGMGPGRRVSFAFVRWKSKIVKEVENLRMAMALLNGAQMNQVGTTVENVYGQLVQSQLDTRGFYALVKQTQCMSMIPAPSWRQTRRRRPTTLTAGGHSSSVTSRNPLNQPEKLPVPIEDHKQTRTSILDRNEMLESVRGIFPASNSSMLANLQMDRYFNFGSCNYLPSDYVEVVKDTIRGVLVEYYFQTHGQSVFELVSNISSSPSTDVQKQKGIIQTRGILSRELEQQQYARALGLFTITHTTTKWRTSHRDSSYYLETRIQVYLDPTPQSTPSRFRLFCISTFDGTPRYMPRFDPVLRVSNRVRYNDPIVVACRDGDLEKVRTLFASGVASPYDCCETDTNISLLDIVFKQLILSLDAPKDPSNYIAKLHIIFKYLVDLGLDPGELNIQHRHAHSSTVQPSDSTYVLRCGYCLEPIAGMYYDCKLCVGGDFCLCQPCIQAGRRCHDPEHHEKQPHVDTNISRTMLHYSPIESLASIYYAKENAPYLVDVARAILCCSKQDPFQNNHGRLLEWKWYEELTNVESPVLELISKQQEWVFRWDETEPEELSAVPLTWKPQDPLELLLRAWVDVFKIHAFNTYFPAFVVFNQLSYLLDDDEVYTEFCIRAALIIDQNYWSIRFLLWARYVLPARRPSLQDLLNHCITTRQMEGYRRIVSKYYPSEEPPFPYRLKVCDGSDDEVYNCTILTRRIGKGGEGDSRNGDEMGPCLLSLPSGQPVLFYDGPFGALWFFIH